MFRSIPKSEGYLFVSRPLRDVFDSATNSLRGEVESLDPNGLLNTAPADLERYLVEKYWLQCPELQKEAMTVEESECQVDVSRDPNRFFHDRPRSYFIPGQRIVVEIPCSGETELFFCSASTATSMPPRGEVRGQALQLAWQFPHDSPARDLKGEIDRSISEIERYLGWSRNDVSGFNSSLAEHARKAIESRRQRLLANTSRVASLGIPIKTRSDAPKTYIAPEVRRKVLPTAPKASTQPYSPEPAMDLATYDHILSIVDSMTHVMERSPSSFATMKEEDLRQHFLVQLNGQYEGQATGETFNAGGKTDILVRSGDRNIFIGECKFWRGEKGFLETVGQVLGYAAWRDTKVAVLVFNRGGNTTGILQTVRDALPKHPNFKRPLEWKHETGIRCVMHHNSDQNREMTVTVLVFDVPTPATGVTNG